MGRGRTSEFDIASNSTFERAEMQCPTCFKKSLIADPERVNEFSGERDKVVYASLCSNPDCQTGRVKPDSIKLQLPSGGKAVQWVKREGLVSVSLVVLVVGAAVLVSLFALGTFAPASPADVEGQVLGVTGGGLGEVAVSLDGETIGTDENGLFSFGLVSPGEYELVVEPSADSEFGAIPPVDVSVGDGVYEIGSSEYVVRSGGGVQVSLPEIQEVSARSVSSATETSLKFETAANAKRGVMVTLRGSEGSSAERREVIESGEPRVLTLLSEPSESNIVVSAEPVERNVSVSETYRGPMTMDIRGSLSPRDVRVVVDENVSSDVFVNRDEVCSVEELEAMGGVCGIPVSSFEGEVLTISFGDEMVGEDFELEYVSRSVAERVVVNVEGESWAFERSEGRVAGDGTWTFSGDFSGLSEGAQTVSVDAFSVEEGRPAEGSVEFVFVESVDSPERPTVSVVNGEGVENSVVVPEERLDDGRLTSTYVMTLPPEWFSAGENVIRVESANGEVVGVEVSAFSVIEQEMVFQAVSEA